MKKLRIYAHIDVDFSTAVLEYPIHSVTIELPPETKVAEIAGYLSSDIESRFPNCTTYRLAEITSEEIIPCG